MSKQPFIQILPSKPHSIYGRLTVLTATKDGGPVLKEESALKNFAGLMIQTKNKRIIVMFRRRSY